MISLNKSSFKTDTNKIKYFNQILNLVLYGGCLFFNALMSNLVDEEVEE